MPIAENMTCLVGRTPMVYLNRMAEGCGARVAVKLETFNPCASVKDRPALNMVLQAEREGVLRPGARLVEPTSGNTGIGLAFVCAVRGYRLTLTMPENFSIERRLLLTGLGAEVDLTPADQGMAGAIRRAREIADHTGAYLPGQFECPANPAAHEEATAKEIWGDCDGGIDVLVAGVGTGGTLTGTARGLRKRKPGMRVVAVEPAESPVLSGGEPGPHGVQGLGSGFVPANADVSLFDEVLTVTTDEAMATARRLMREEGILCGISSGANVAVALRQAALPENSGRLVVTFVCDSAERYLSTPLFRDML